MQPFILADRSALVTGASSGIGHALSHALAGHGARLALVARRADRLEKLAAEIAALGHPRPLTIPFDLAAAGAPEAVFGAARAALGPVDLVVNNAGFGRYGPTHATEPETLAGILHVNIEAMVRLTRLALPEMVDRREGAILNIASTAGFIPLPYMATYAASKAFVVSFSQAVSAEVKRHGVRVVCLCPGRTRTEFFTVANYDSGVRLNLADAGMTPEAVAQEGIAALLSGAPLRSAGFLNRWMVGAFRLLPRRFALDAAEWLMRPQG